MSPRGFLTSSAITYAATALGVVCMAAFYGVSLRAGTASFGVLQSVMSLLFLLFACRGVAGSYVVLHAAGNERILPAVALKALKMALLLGVALAGIFLLLAPVLRDFLHLSTTLPFLLIAAACVPAMLSGIVEGVLNVQGRFGALAVSSAIIPAANLVFCLLLLGDGFQESDAGWIILGGQLVACVNILFLGPSFLRGAQAFTEKRSALREVGALLAASLLFGASLRLDVFWARHVLTEEAAGAYAVAASIALVLYLITSGVARVTSVSLRQTASDTKLIEASYGIIIATSAVLAIAFAAVGHSLLDAIAGRVIPIDWGVLTPLFVAFTAYSIVTFDYTCLNVVTKNVHAGIGVALIVVQGLALVTFGSDTRTIAWAQCVSMLVVMVAFSVSLLRAIASQEAAPGPYPAEAHLATQG